MGRSTYTLWVKVRIAVLNFVDYLRIVNIITASRGRECQFAFYCDYFNLKFLSTHAILSSKFHQSRRTVDIHFIHNIGPDFFNRSIARAQLFCNLLAAQSIT